MFFELSGIWKVELEIDLVSRVVDMVVGESDVVKVVIGGVRMGVVWWSSDVGDRLGCDRIGD